MAVLSQKARKQRTRAVRVDSILAKQRGEKRRRNHQQHRCPWANTTGSTRHFAVHAPKMPAIDIHCLLDLAKSTPYYRDAALAVNMLTDPTLWEPAKTDVTTPPSHVARRVVQALVDAAVLVPSSGRPLSWGLLSTVPEERKQRLRPISDTLFSNHMLPDAPTTEFGTLESLLGMCARGAYAATVDFRGWYYQIPIAPAVRPFMSVSVAGEIFEHARAPMGHKWMVFVANTFTKVLAYVDSKVETDVIIDNVLFTGSRADVQRAVAMFRMRCGIVGATIGDEAQGIAVDHRGVTLDFLAKTVKLKTDWVLKFVARATSTLQHEPTADQLYSLGGMLAWARSVLGAQVPDDYALWRHIAKAARMCADDRPCVKLPWPPAARRELDGVLAWISHNPERQARAVYAIESLVVTDAALSPAKASWGGILVTDTVRLWTGTFAGPQRSIVECEMAAVLLTLERAERFLCSDVVVVSDNTAVVHVIGRGRSSSKCLHNMVKSLHSFFFRCGRSFVCMWVRSEHNPADGISRGKPFTDGDMHLLHSLSEEIGRSLEGDARHLHYNKIN
jgi:hypothetical protein